MRHLFLSPLSFLLLVLLSMSANTYADAPIGRLFFSVEERAKFDRARERGIPESQEPATDATAEQEKEIVPPKEQFTLDGVVRRSSGKSTVWVNRQSLNQDDNLKGQLIPGKTASPRAVAVQLPSGKNVRLKAGQTFDVVTGRLREPYESAPEKIPVPAK